MPVRPAPRPRRAAPRPVLERSRGRGPSRTFAVYSAVVTNAGSAETSPTIEVTGPTPATWFVANGAKALRVNYAVPAGQVLSIDFATRAATLDGAPVSGIVDLASSKWWTLAAGANTVVASVAATVRHRHAYR